MYKPVHIERGVQRLTENYVIENAAHHQGVPPASKPTMISPCSCAKGEIHALLGENGAGKSTLDERAVRPVPAGKGCYQDKNGREVKINNPNDANALGIGMVHQHFKLVECFTVLDNIILAWRTQSMGFCRRTRPAKGHGPEREVRPAGGPGRPYQRHFRWHAAARGDPENALPRQ